MPITAETLLSINSAFAQATPTRPPLVPNQLSSYVAINADGSVRQFQIIEYLEAYGYQVRELKWRDQFVGKTAESTLQVGADIGNISGATLSVRHMTDGIKRLLVLCQTVLR